MLNEPKVSVETALQMLDRYARLNGIPGQDLMAIFDVGMVAARLLNPAILGADELMVQRYDQPNGEPTSGACDERPSLPKADAAPHSSVSMFLTVDEVRALEKGRC